MTSAAHNISAHKAKDAPLAAFLDIEGIVVGLRIFDDHATCWRSVDYRAVPETQSSSAARITTGMPAASATSRRTSAKAS